VRTDGKDGAGTAADPFDAGTQVKFDALFKSFGSNTLIHLGPGTYHTKGAVGFGVKPYGKIRGSGYEVTRIIQDRSGVIHSTVFRGHADGAEIEDLSIDCGFQNQQVVNGRIKANASAIGLGGSHIAVRRCLIKNYGSPYDDETGENFAVFIGSASPANGENLLVEDCIFAGMTPLLKSGQSVLTIAGGPPTNNLTAGNWARGCIARRNHFTGLHYGGHGITMSGTQGGMIVDNVFEHFMGACVYHDTWPMRDIVIARNIMSDVNQGIRLTCNDMNNFHIYDNIMLMNDGYDIAAVKGGVVTTVINHSLAVANKIKFHKVNVTAGKGLTSDCAFVTSVPSPNTFTYALTSGGTNETSDAGAGGYIQALDYQGCLAPAPEAIVVCGSGGKEDRPPRNFIIERNIIKPYSSDDTARVPSSGISVWAMKDSQITGNVIVDSGHQAELRIGAPEGATSSVICRDNYHPDGTLLLPRDGRGKVIEGGLLDLPFEAGQNVTLTPTNGRIRIAVSGIPPLARPVDPAGPAGNRQYPGKPGDYALQGGFLYIYAGDGATNTWKRCPLLDY